MSKIAFFTFGVLREPDDHPQIQDFVDRGGPTFEVAEASEGFVDRSVFDEETELESWGDGVPPRFAQRCMNRYRGCRVVWRGRCVVNQIVTATY